MANGIDRRYTGIPIIPQVVEEKTSMWDAIVPLAQMAKEEKVRQDALNLKWTEIRHKNEEASDLKQHRADDLAQRKVYQKGQLDIAQERNQIAKMEFEKKKSDEREAEEFAVAGSAKDYKDQVRLLRELADSTGKTSYNARADLIEQDGIAKEAMSEFKNNLSQEDNPYKIQEYLRREGENLIKHYGQGAFNILQKRADSLISTYDVTEANVRNSDIYKGLREEIHVKMGQPGMFNKDPDGNRYTIDDYREALASAALDTEQQMQEGLIQEGIMPTDDDAMDKIWDNEEAREAYFANPLDDVNKIMEKYELIEKEEVDEDDEPKEDETDVQAVGYSDVYDKIKALDDNSIITIQTPDGKTQEIRAKEYQALPGLVSDKKQREGMKIVAIQGGTAFTENQMKRSAMKFMGDDTPVYKIGTNQPVMVEGMKGNKLIVGGEEYTFEEYSEKFTNVPYTKY